MIDYNDGPQLMYYDNFYAHDTNKVLGMLRDKNYVNRTLEPATSHIGQPCDQHVGRSLQQKVKTNARHKRDQLVLANKRYNADQLRQFICRAVGEAWAQITTNETEMMKNAWRNLGILRNVNEWLVQNNVNLGEIIDSELANHEE